MNSSSSRSRVISWSPSVTLVPTRQCFNACAYCHFRLPVAPEAEASQAGVSAEWLSDQQALERLQRRPEASEVLLLSGEVAPHAANRRIWFERLRSLSKVALHSARLPHSNAGPLNRHEMAALARLNLSMGLMLEGLGPAYERVHRHAPSKTLAMRLGQLEQAGRLGVPFTTGLLLGLGERPAQRHEALELLAQLQRQWGHLQEVILQPWQPDGPSSALGPAAVGELLETIAAAREILPPEVHLQLPPNLWPRQHLLQALEAGIDDLGGIDDVDVINPSWPQPAVTDLAAQLVAAGWTLHPRLCVHDGWLAGLPAPLRRQPLIAQRLAQPATL